MHCSTSCYLNGSQLTESQPLLAPPNKRLELTEGPFGEYGWLETSSRFETTLS